MKNSSLSPELSERARRVSDDVLALVLDAVREGRDAATQDLGAFCRALLAELERQYDELGPNEVERFVQQYEGAAPAPVVAAHFGAAHQVVDHFEEKLRRRGW